MKKLKRAELMRERWKGTTLGKIRRKEKEENKALEITPKALLIFISIFGILVCSGAYYFTQNGGSDNDENFEEILYMSTSTTMTSSSTSTSSLTTTTSSTSTSIIFTSTTTTIECGGDLQLPCEIESGKECDEGNIIGSEGLCHTPECAPSVPSGKEGCGGWALNYCQS